MFTVTDEKPQETKLIMSTKQNKTNDKKTDKDTERENYKRNRKRNVDRG